MDTKDLLELYKSLFETWRFEVNSHWQRSSYFAAFETVAVAACWKLLSDLDSAWAGAVLAALGLCLTGIWYRNNNKTHFYAVYWLEKVAEIERKLVQQSGEAVDFAAQILNRPNRDRIRHRHLVQAVPIIFFIAWAILLCLGIYKYSAHGRGWWTTMESGIVSHLVSYQSITLAAAIGSLLAGVAAVLVAKSSLSQAKQVADRELKDWKQRKWFDLYFRADEAYDALERFQALYPGPADVLTEEGKKEWNSLMLVMRAVHRMAGVFPKHPAIEDFLASTAIFKDMNLALSAEQRQKIFDAVDKIREHALIGDLSVLQ
jgi:DNA-directed RNA polymerase subunit F